MLDGVDINTVRGLLIFLFGKGDVYIKRMIDTLNICDKKKKHLNLYSEKNPNIHTFLLNCFAQYSDYFVKQTK